MLLVLTEAGQKALPLSPCSIRQIAHEHQAVAWGPGVGPLTGLLPLRALRRGSFQG